MVVGREMTVSSADLVLKFFLDMDCEGLASPQEVCDFSCRCCVCIVFGKGRVMVSMGAVCLYLFGNVTR